MFGKSFTAAIALLMVFSASVANGGVIVHQQDSPEVSFSAAVNFSVPGEQPRDPELRDGPVDDLDVSEIRQEGTSSPNATTLDPDDFSMKRSMTERLSLIDVEIPRDPDLIGLLKPPQKDCV